MIAALACLSLQLTAVGLQPGEALVELAPAPPATAGGAPSDGELAHGRVVDAFTGSPVAGAAVEAWTEEIDEAFGGFHRIGEGRSGADGRFAVQVKTGERAATKVRVRAPGYLTLSATDSDLHGALRVFPAPEAPVRLRVVDSRDRPIAGARFTSTYSCSHDLPAFDARTDARGIVELAELGLQDDIVELRLGAPGHASIEYLEPEPALLQPRGAEPWTVRLPRRRPVVVRLLDALGRPHAGAALQVIDDECYHVVRTDAEGLLRVPSRYGSGELQLELLGLPRKRFIGVLRPPLDRIASLRPQAEDWPDELPTGQVVFDWGDAGPPADGVELQLFHEAGWTWTHARDLREPLEFPAGAGFLTVGGAFTGVAPETHAFELAAGATVTLRPALVREPRVTLRVPAATPAGGGRGRVWIEAGDDTLEEAPLGEPVPVPAGVPLCCFYTGPGGARRVRVDAASDGLVIDLRPTSTRVVPGSPESTGSAAREVGCVEVAVAGESADERGTLSVHLPNDELEVTALEPGRYAIEGPVGLPFLAAYRRAGHAQVWFRAEIPAGPAAPAPAALALQPVPLAALELEASFPFTAIGLDADELGALHPGPLQLVLQRDDGRRYGLSLELAPGARRRVQIASGAR